MNKEIVVDKLQQYYKNRQEEVFVYLFGSYAKGRNQVKSDIDIGVYVKDTFNRELFEYKIEESARLQDFLRKHADIVILNNASPILVHQIFRYGILIKSTDNKFLSNFRVLNFYKYLDQVRMSNIIFHKNRQRVKVAVENG